MLKLLNKVTINIALFYYLNNRHIYAKIYI